MKPAPRPSREEVLLLVAKVGVSEAARQSGVPKGTVGKWATAGNRKRETKRARGNAGNARDTRGRTSRAVDARARPPRFTDPALAARIEKAVLTGVPMHMACQAAGVAQPSWFEWLAKARAGTEPYAAFVARLEAAEAQAAVDIVGEVRAKPNGAAPLVELLGRRFRVDFGKTVEHQVSVVHLGPELSRLPVGELAALLERAAPRQIVDAEVVEPAGE